MKLAILAFSDRGMRLGERLQSGLSGDGDTVLLDRCVDGGLAAWTNARLTACDGLIFVGSCGIAVRAIATHVKSKISDPAVVAVDECATFAVSLLSGHIGGANALSQRIARHTGAIPVITTATDRSGVFSIDAWASRRGLWIANPERIKWVSARLIAGERIRVRSLFPVAGALPDGFIVQDDAPDVLITYRTRGRAEALKLVPPVVTLGVGCKRGISAAAIEEAFALVLKKANCCPEAVRNVYSIDLKRKEAGILAFCRQRQLPYRTFSADRLAAAPGHFTASAFVQSVAGVDNVCERSAVLGAGAGGRLLTQKNAEHGVTMALAIAPYTVRFQEEPI